MIIGVGTDLCDIRRIERSLSRFGDRFVQRLYDESEQRAVERRPQRRASGYAMRFAAKEACAKALGTGFRKGVFWRDMIVANEPSGKPVLRLQGGALERLHELTPVGWTPVINISLTDETPLSHAIVIISAVPEGAPVLPSGEDR
ncbi:MAG: holo-ACP synthase [Rhodospirillales bacterium]